MNGEQASASAGASYKNRWEVDDDPALLSMTAIGVYAEEYQLSKYYLKLIKKRDSLNLIQDFIHQ